MEDAPQGKSRNVWRILAFLGLFFSLAATGYIARRGPQGSLGVERNGSHRQVRERSFVPDGRALEGEDAVRSGGRQATTRGRSSFEVSSYVDSKIAVADMPDRFSIEARDRRAGEVEAMMTALEQDVLAEKVDRGWAVATEDTFRELLELDDGVGTITDQVVKCGSRRCLLKATVSNAAAREHFQEQVYAVHSMPRARVRITHQDGGELHIRAVLARTGFGVDGTERPGEIAN